MWIIRLIDVCAEAEGTNIIFFQRDRHIYHSIRIHKYPFASVERTSQWVWSISLYVLSVSYFGIIMILIRIFHRRFGTTNLRRGTNGAYKVGSPLLTNFFSYTWTINRTIDHIFKVPKSFTTWINSLLVFTFCFRPNSLLFNFTLFLCTLNEVKYFDK